MHVALKGRTGRKELYERPELLYLILAVIFSIVFMVIFTPWNSVDGPTHFMASYRYSNKLMGLPEWSVRGNDQDVVYENLYDLAKVHDNANELSLEFASSFVGVPYHAGAVQYFADKGIEVPAE